MLYGTTKNLIKKIYSKILIKHFLAPECRLLTEVKLPTVHYSSFACTASSAKNFFLSLFWRLHVEIRE